MFIHTHKLKKENKFHFRDVLPLGNLSKLYFSHRNSKNANVYKFSLKQNKSLMRKPVTLPFWFFFSKLFLSLENAYYFIHRFLRLKMTSEAILLNVHLILAFMPMCVIQKEKSALSKMTHWLKTYSYPLVFCKTRKYSLAFFPHFRQCLG